MNTSDRPAAFLQEKTVKELTTAALFDISHTRARVWLEDALYPFMILGMIGKITHAVGESLPASDYERAEDDVWIARDAKIAGNVSIKGPAVIDRGTEVRPGAYLRGNVLIGENCVVGNSTEIKNAILFDGAKVPHFNYVGDSVLGYLSHMGAGSVTSNVRLDKAEIVIAYPGGILPTGRKKCGAVLGDRAEIGCHAVLNPGAVIGRDAVVYPLTSVRGYVPAHTIAKNVNNRG